ncbi:MAG: BrnT family toxin [Desulfobacterales bacterium]|nr:BrnT family toxin [Desulfobacterales bacterium]
MKSIEFEWDDQKNKANQKKHKVSFEEAKTAFYDKNARVIDDPDHSEEEQFILFGISNKLRIIAIVHCYREDDKIIRIISARKAVKNEIKQYEAFI